MTEALETPERGTSTPAATAPPRLGSRVRALVAVVRRDALISMSYRTMVVTQPVGVLFTLALFYFVSRILGSSARFPTPDAYFAFVAVGVVIQSLVRSSLGVPLAVRQELVAGTYERFELSAAGGTLGVVGMLVYPLLYALGLAAFTLAAAAVVFGLEVQWSTAAWGLPLGVLSGLAFAPFALVFSAITLAFKQAPGQGSAVAVVSLVSGLYFPVDVLPGWVRWTSQIQPFTPAVDLMRHVLVGYALPQPLWAELLRLVAFVAIGVPAAAWTVSAARRYGRRRGTLLES